MVTRRKKKSVWTQNIILMGALGVLGLGSYLLVFKHKPKSEAEAELSKQFFNLKDRSIESVKLSFNGQVTEFHCLDMAAKLCKAGDNSKWEMVSPLKVRADDANVNSLISAVSTLAATDVIDLTSDTSEKRAQLMKEYGLDPAGLSAPATRIVEVKTPEGLTTAYLGFNHPIGDGYYSVIESGPRQQKPETSRVLIAPSFFKANFEKELTHWRDKKLLNLASHEVDSFQVKTQQTMTSGKRVDGRWEILSGATPKDPLAGDSESIDSMISAATYLNAKDFAAESKTSPAAKTALSGAKTVVSLTLNKTIKDADPKAAPKVESTQLTLFQKGADSKGKKNPADVAATKFYMTVSTAEPLYEVDASVRERLEKGIKELRQNKLITSSDRFGVKKITLSGEPIGKDDFVVAQKDNQWTLEKEGKPADADKVSAFLEKLSGNRVRDFLSTVPAEPEKKAVQILLETETTGSPKKLLRFSIWKATGSLYARDLDSKRKEVMVLDPTIEKELPWSRDFFNVTPKPTGSAGAPPPMPMFPQGGESHDGHAH